MTLTDWAALLLADCSSNNLLLFSDWLELDQDGEELAQAARGVRELLVESEQKPEELTVGSFAWAVALVSPVGWLLPQDIYNQLEMPSNKTLYHCWYDYDWDDESGKATAHLAALLDAAQAWAKCNPEPLTKGKVTT